MDLEAAFLDDIVANPHDPTLWLIFADWLEERADPRAEVVRLWRADATESNYERLWTLLAAGVRLPLPRHVNTLGIEFVWVPPGAFWMGGGNGKCGDQLVTFAEPFYLGVYPVTQGQWQALMADNPSTHSRTGVYAKDVQLVSTADLDLFPVENVSWDDVQQFLAALNATGSGSGWAYRLPTSAEWEYAVRSPIPGPASSTVCKSHCGFSFYLDMPANKLAPEQANTESKLNRPTKVGLYQSNGLGIYDLHGNIWEWTDTSDGSNRVFRGGSWASASTLCRAAQRTRYASVGRSGSLGFRLARVLSEQ